MPQTTGQKLSVSEFANRVREKHEGAYDDLDDTILTRRVLSKYPTYTDMVDLPDLDKPLDAATIQGEAKKHGLILTSGKRSPEHNAAVGGAKSSYHLTGNAFDFGGPPDKMRAFYDHMRDTYGGRMKEILHGEGDHRDHVHVAFGDDKTPSAVPAKSTIPPSRSFSWSSARPAATGATATPTPEEARGRQPEEAGLAQPGARATHLAGMTPADQTARFAEGKRKRGWLIPGEDIKDATALDQRLKDLAQVRAGLMGRPEQERGPSLAVVDEKIRHLARVKNDLAKMEAARHQKPSDALRQQMHVREMPLPSEGDRPPDRAADLPWYLKGYAADVGAGAQEGITGLGDAILGIEKMFGVKPSAEFEPALETGHELAQSTTERGGKGIGHEVVRGLTAMGVQLPALAAGGTPMLALVGAAQAAAKPDARPEDVARGAATMALMGKILHQSGGLTMPKRILTGVATGAGVGAIEGGSREQVIAQALLFGGLGVVGGKGSKVQGRDGRTYEVTSEQGEQVTLKPVGQTSEEPLIRAGSTTATEAINPLATSESAHPESTPKTTAGHTLERVNQEGSKHFYSIVNPEGEHIGSVHIEVPEGSEVGRIDWMEAGALGGEENALGPKAVRDVLREIKRQHPQLEEVEGLRHSGAKSRGAGPEQNVRMKLPREGDRRVLDKGPPEGREELRFEMPPGEREQVERAVKEYRTYEETQAAIDEAESRLEKQGTDPLKSYDAYGGKNDLLESMGWKPMPDELAELYRWRDTIGRHEDAAQIESAISQLEAAGVKDSPSVRVALEEAQKRYQSLAMSINAGEKVDKSEARTFLLDETRRQVYNRLSHDAVGHGGFPEDLVGDYDEAVRVARNWPDTAYGQNPESLLRQVDEIMRVVTGEKQKTETLAGERQQVADAVERFAEPGTHQGTARVDRQPWEMSQEEIESAYQREQVADKTMLTDFFGEEGAKRYQGLQRKANSVYASMEDVEKASAAIEQMEGTLTKLQQDRLFGIGLSDAENIEVLRDYRNALGQVGGATPAELAESIKYALTKMGEKTDPREMNPKEQLAYAQLRHGFEIAREQGWDTAEISRMTAEGAAKRWRDPADAYEMLKRFARKEPQDTQPTAPTQRQLPEAASNSKTEPLSTRSFGASNKIVTQADHAAALARLKQRLKSPTLSSGLDPELIADAARVGAYYLEGGARSFAAWSARMVADLGDEIKPHLTEIWSAAQGHLKEAETEYTGLKKAVVAEERIERGADPIEAEAARTWGPLWEQTRREVGEGHVDPLGLARQVTEAPRPMTDREVTVLLHGKRRAQNQRYAAMDDMEAATGKGDRAARTDAEMRLERAETDMDAIEQASRAGMRENARGMSMMRAMVRDDYSLARLNQRARVAAGGDLKPEQGTRLREIGDRLDKAERGVGDIERHLEDYKRQEREYKQKSDPQRLAETKRRLHREIGELTRKLSSQDYVRDLKREGVSLDDEGLLLKKRRDELQREMGRKRKELEDLSGETERRESESRLKAYKTRVEKQIGDLLKQLATRDFAKKEHKPLTLDEAAEALKERRDQLRKAADYEIKKIKYEARPVGQQIADRLSWYQRANLMSGPAGAARDVISTGLWQTMDGLIFRPARAAVEQVSARLSGRQPEAYVGETGAALKGWMQGIGPGFREAVGTIARGYGPEAAARYDLPLMYEGPGGWKNPLNLVLRTRGALNELQRFMGVGAELAAEAYRQVRREGLTGAEARLRFEELRRNPTDEMVETAARHGERMTFTDKSDKVLNALYKVRELEIPRTGLRPGTFIFPFVRTTYNMMKRGLELTPMGFAKLLRKDMSHLERADTIAKAALGSAFMTTLALTAELAGAAPNDPANRARFYASGRQPWSIKVGGYWVPFKDLGPVGVPMAIVAAFKDKYAQGGGAFEPDLAKATAAAGRYTFVDQTAFRTVGSWYDALTGDPRSKGLPEIGGNFAQGFVPFSSALRTVAESQDAYLRNPQVWYEWVMEGLPGLRPQVPTHKTLIENKKQGLKALSPVVPTRDQGSYRPSGGSGNPFH